MNRNSKSRYLLRLIIASALHSCKFVKQRLKLVLTLFFWVYFVICEAGARMSLWLKQQSMGDEKDAFYVVRKGNVIGIYKSLSDLQALIRSSVSSQHLF